MYMNTPSPQANAVANAIEDMIRAVHSGDGFSQYEANVGLAHQIDELLIKALFDPIDRFSIR